MIPFIQIIDALAVHLWRASWQGALLLLLTWSICRLFKSIPAKYQAWLWRLVILKFLVASCWIFSVDLPLLPSDTPASTRQVQVVTHPAPVDNSLVDLHPTENARIQEPFNYKLGLWMIALTTWTGVAGWQLVQLYKNCREAIILKNSCRPIREPSLNTQLTAACQAMGVKVPPLLETDGGGSPMLVGIFSPAIIIPSATLHKLNHHERAIAITHELAHLRHYDLCWTLVAAIVRSVFFFNPLVWIAESRLKITQEIAADELAIEQLTGSPANYGTLLLSLVTKLDRTCLAPSMSVGTVGSSLKERLIAMRFVKPRSIGTIVSCRVLLAAVCVVGVAPWKLVAAESKTASISSSKDSASNNSQNTSNSTGGSAGAQATGSGATSSGTSSVSSSKSSSSSSSSSSTPNMHTESSGSGGRAYTDGSITINGKTQRFHSESVDGKPEKVTVDGQDANQSMMPPFITDPNMLEAMKKFQEQINSTFNGFPKMGGTGGGGSAGGSASGSAQATSGTNHSSNSKSSQSSSSSATPNVHTESSGSGGRAVADGTYSINGITHNFHSESVDGKPQTESVDRQDANGPKMTPIKPNEMMQESFKRIEQQIKSMDIPEEMKKQMLDSIRKIQ